MEIVCFDVWMSNINVGYVKERVEKIVFLFKNFMIFFGLSMNKLMDIIKSCNFKIKKYFLSISKKK